MTVNSAVSQDARVTESRGLDINFTGVPQVILQGKESCFMNNLYNCIISLHFIVKPADMKVFF